MIAVSDAIAVRRGSLVITLDVPVHQVLAAGDIDDVRGALLAQFTAGTLAALADYVRILRTQKEAGVVKWFDDKKGYGFLHTRSGDLFVHWRGIAGDGYRSLAAGQRVRFFRRPGVTDDGSEEALDVEVMPETAGQGPPPEATARPG